MEGRGLVDGVDLALADLGLDLYVPLAGAIAEACANVPAVG